MAISPTRENALDHVVVVLFENRSLDNVLCRLYGLRDGKTFEGVLGRDLSNPIRGEACWRPLLPTALVTGVGSWAYTLAATLWIPRTVTGHYEQFGSFGIALAFVTWFTGLAFLVIGAAVLGPVLAEGDNALGRWLRAAQSSPLEPSAAPPLPGPLRPMRLSDAFGLGDKGGHGEPPA